MRNRYTIHIEEPDLFKRKLLIYSQKFEYSAFYNSCGYNDLVNGKTNYSSFDFLAGVGDIDRIVGSFNSLEQLNKNAFKDWLFGYLGYDLKNEFESLYSVNDDSLFFSPIIFFQPRYVFINKKQEWWVEYDPKIDSELSVCGIVDEIHEISLCDITINPIHFSSKINRKEYINSIESVLKHIHKGDIYELNYCMEFCADSVEINPVEVYIKLTEISPTPFNAFLKIEDRFIISASPERYLKKEGDKLISQPIKGTAPRSIDIQEDERNAYELQHCIKERSENIMIADLVRNDLSRVAKMGSVKVEELCGIYRFPQVFQMITTVVAEIDKEYSGLDAIKYSFPMGSMTGAPKIRAMKLIEKYEETKRGVYSGAVGYFAPNGDFDFNVVIRSLLYNSVNKYLSFMVGSAITEKSIPEKEYDECLVKASAIFKLFNS